MTFAKAFLISLAVLCLIGLGVWQFLLKDVAEFAKVGTAYAAKQICSCRFVSAREMASCRVDFTQDLSQLNVSEIATDTEQSVTASALWLISAKAVHQPGLGCVLEP